MRFNHLRISLMLHELSFQVEAFFKINLQSLEDAFMLISQSPMMGNAPNMKVSVTNGLNGVGSRDVYASKISPEAGSKYSVKVFVQRLCW